MVAKQLFGTEIWLYVGWVVLLLLPVLILSDVVGLVRSRKKEG